MKKAIAFVAIALFVATLAACSGQRRAPATTTYSAPSTTYAPSMPAPSSTAPAGAPAGKSCGGCGGPGGCG